MSSTNVAKGVAWVDKRLVGVELAEPEEIKLNGVTQGQLNIMPGICKMVLPARLTVRSITLVMMSYPLLRRWNLRTLSGCHPTKARSRVNGAALFADMLEAVVEGKKLESGIPEKPAFYVFDYCRGWISRVPVLVRDSKNPDDVDTQQEDHDWDGTRYAVLHSPPKKVGKVTNLRI